MKLNLSKGQFEKLSDLAMDIAKGLLVSSFVVPVFEHSISFLASSISILTGLIFVAFSLKLEEVKERTK